MWEAQNCFPHNVIDLGTFSPPLPQKNSFVPFAPSFSFSPSSKNLALKNKKTAAMYKATTIRQSKPVPTNELCWMDGVCGQKILFFGFCSYSIYSLFKYVFSLAIRFIRKVPRLGSENGQFGHNRASNEILQNVITGTQTSFSTNFDDKLSFILSFILPERLHCCYVYFHCSYLYNYYN